ncbi:GntR family transcriptional regulator [Stieleria maiorica]|nr:GntR family transcriptional regulator [Stieleria maiorica]
MPLFLASTALLDTLTCPHYHLSSTPGSRRCGEAMLFTIDPSNGVAIYLQIVRQIKFAIAERTLRPGQLIPSVRALSQQMTVNPNTVTRALQDLQAEGIVETLRGKGMVVCDGATATCRIQRKEIIADRITGVLTEALSAGLSGKEVQQIVSRKLKALEGKVAQIGAPVPD